MAALNRKLFGISTYRWAILSVLFCTLFVFSIYLRGRLDIEWSVESLRAFVQSLGAWGPLSYIGILIFRFIFLIPSGILLIAAGVLFGPIYGAAYAGLGLSGAGLWKFGMVNIVGQEIILRQLPQHLRVWVTNIAERKMSLWALSGICAYPFIPKHIFQFGAILSGMALGSFVLAVTFGSFVRAGIFAFVGEAMYSGSGLMAMSLVFITLLVVPMFVPPWRAWMLNPLQVAFPINKSRSDL